MGPGACFSVAMHTANGRFQTLILNTDQLLTIIFKRGSEPSLCKKCPRNILDPVKEFILKQKNACM